MAANQAGNTDYSAAPTVSHSIVVTAAMLTVMETTLRGLMARQIQHLPRAIRGS